MCNNKTCRMTKLDHLQNVILDITKYIDKLCKDNNISNCSKIIL